MAIVKNGKVQDLKFDDKNFNRGSEKGMELLKKSLEEFGAGRSVLVDKDNRLIAGNKTAEKWAEQGGKTIIVETDGSELVVVKRKDISIDSDKGREMALADNMVSKVNFVLAEDVVAEVLSAEVIEAWDVFDKPDNNSAKNVEIENDDLTNKMTLKLQYSEKEYRWVKQKLEQTNEVIEDALLELLGYEQ